MGEVRVKLGVKYIGEGGKGSEAHIDIELRTEFPGIGGTIYTYQAIPAALRVSYNPSANVGHREFIKHAVLKKLEDYFFMKEIYGYAHITRPLGSMAGAYIYEWAFGLDGFSWYYNDSDKEVTVNLEDWGKFINTFSSVGIDMQTDCTDPDDGRRSQNIVHQLLALQALRPKLNCLWKRIDFGDRSISIDYHKLLDFIYQTEVELREALRHGRYELLELACRYLAEGEIRPREMRQLEALVIDYRLSTLRHLNASGVESEKQTSVQFELKPDKEQF